VRHGFALALFIGVAIPSAAGAQEIALTVVGEVTCPSREAIVDALLRLAPAARVGAALDHPDLAVTVLDLGDRYRVDTDVTKVLEDPARRCDERARATALIVALAIDALPRRLSPVAPPVLVPPPLVATRPHGPGPWALIDRPLVLPRGRAQIGEAATLGALRVGTSYATGGTNVLDFDAGVGRSVQLGAWIAAPLRQGRADLSIVPRVTLGLHRDVALRIELGFDRSHLVDHQGNEGDANGGLFALTLVTRYRFHRMFTLTVGDTGPRAEWPLQVGTIYNETLGITSHALFALHINEVFFVASICIPVGILFQPHRIVALQLGAGMRVRFDENGIPPGGTSFPVSFDLIITPHPRVDLGLGLDVPFQLSDAVGLLQSAFFVRARI